MPDLNLPQDLVAFLRDGHRCEYDPTTCEAGTVTFLPLDQLKLELFPIISDSAEDPHAGESGCYLVKGVSLIASCDNYDPEGLLLWLPLDECYGLWDGEHGTLIVFGADVCWTEIAEDLPRHINAEWGIENSAPVTSLNPWLKYSYNTEQVSHPLPDLAEWYDFHWVRRGVYRDGVQLRFPEEILIRIAQDAGRCEVTSQIKNAEEGAVFSTPLTVWRASEEWQCIQPGLEAGFWKQPLMAPGGPGGEPSTYWSISGFRNGAYHRLARFYEENRAKGDPVHELGKQIARLATLGRLETDDT
jgi:hypothetical protein